MADVYAARSNAKKHIIEQCANCNLKKNSNGLYNHGDIVKAKETIEGHLKEVFLQHQSGEKMPKLLEVNDNPINTATTTHMVTVDMLLTQSKKEAAKTTDAAKKIAKSLKLDVWEVTPVMTREEASRESDKQNIANQTIIGTKVGIVEIMKRLIGGDILDTVTKIADGSRDKSIDDYKLHEVFQLALDNAVRPEVDDVLDIVVEMYQSEFDFRSPISHSIAQLKMMANKLKPFGLTPGEPELMLIILANIHYAKEQVWGHEFRAAMAAIRKQFNYDHIHDKASWTFIVKELACADELRNMKLAPAPNVNKANAVQKYKSALDEWSNSSLAESSMDSYQYESDFDSSQEACMRVVEQQERLDKKERKKLRETKQYKSKRSAKSSDTSSDEESEEPMTCKYCIKYSNKQHPKHVTPDTCMYNKKVRKFRYNSVCKKMNLKYIAGSEFKTGEEDKWPKHKKYEGKKDDN